MNRAARKPARTPNRIPAIPMTAIVAALKLAVGSVRTCCNGKVSATINPVTPPTSGITFLALRSRVRIIQKSPSTTAAATSRSEEHTSELQSHSDLVCRLLLEKKKKKNKELHNNKETNSE